MTTAIVRATIGAQLILTGGRLVTLGMAVEDVLVGLGHRAARAGCRVAGVDADGLVEPIGQLARRVAGLPAVSGDVEVAFFGIAEQLERQAGE